MYPKYWDRHAWVNRVDPDQTSQIAASDAELHHMSQTKQFLDTNG